MDLFAVCGLPHLVRASAELRWLHVWWSGIPPVVAPCVEESGEPPAATVNVDEPSAETSVETPAAAAPSVEVSAEAPVAAASVEVPSVDVMVEAPVAAASAEVPSVDVIVEAPVAAASVDVPSVDVAVEAPVAETSVEVSAAEVVIGGSGKRLKSHTQIELLALGHGHSALQSSMAEGDGRWIGEEWLETCLAQVRVNPNPNPNPKPSPSPNPRAAATPHAPRGGRDRPRAATVRAWEGVPPQGVAHLLTLTLNLNLPLTLAL